VKKEKISYFSILTSHFKLFHVEQLKVICRSDRMEKDNIESMNHIELGYLGGNFGIKIKNKEMFVSDIINALEDMEEPPPEIKEYYPDITDQEWLASARLSTLILLLFEKSLKEKFLEKPENQELTDEHRFQPFFQEI
jgi:hypothetical protein